MDSSTKSEGERLDACVKKLNLEFSIHDRRRLPDQLVHSRYADCAIPQSVYVTSVGSGDRLSVDEYAEAHRIAVAGWSHNQMQITGMKSIRDAPGRLIEHDCSLLHCPIARERPMIVLEARWNGVNVRLIQYRTTQRREVLSALISDIVFSRAKIGPVGICFR